MMASGPGGGSRSGVQLLLFFCDFFYPQSGIRESPHRYFPLTMVQAV
uniref:Uncharacterized protein n=1 Tax=Human betaherpesvirus 6 TaxID=10368 RepID=A0A5P9VHX3_9BETA|nr:hypothetical protein [Human betaherpesvirus 6]